MNTIRRKSLIVAALDVVKDKLDFFKCGKFNGKFTITFGIKNGSVCSTSTLIEEKYYQGKVPRSKTDG